MQHSEEQTKDTCKSIFQLNCMDKGARVRRSLREPSSLSTEVNAHNNNECHTVHADEPFLKVVCCLEGVPMYWTACSDPCHADAIVSEASLCTVTQHYWATLQATTCLRKKTQHTVITSCLELTSMVLKAAGACS